MSNPYDILITGLWTRLENTTAFTDLVKPTNRIKIRTGFKPFKETLVESSVPEVTILPTGLVFWPEKPCDGATILQRLALYLVTGYKNTDKLNEVLWAITQALYDYEDDLFTLEYDGSTFVIHLSLDSADIGLTYDEETKDLKGWVAVIPIEAKLQFNASKLRQA